ncbi:MAG: PAS domain S-box protein [Acidobacteria bacterium]|nr:PAS domain S-box protein [Acidobacteriota bacterium]
MLDEDKTKEELIDELQRTRRHLDEVQAAQLAARSSAAGSLQNRHNGKLAAAALQESEATLRSLYNSASMLMGVVELHDNDVLHISVNQATINFFGLAPEAIIGKLASQLGASENLSRLWIAAYRESERSGEPFRFEYQLQGRKGERLLAATVSHIGEIAAGHNRFCYIIEDITERRRIAEAASESEARYRHLVNNAGDIIYKTDANGKITLFNPTATRILGYSEAELLGRHYLDVVHPDYRQTEEQFYSRQFVKRLSETHLEFPALAKDGSIIWLEQSVRLVLQGDEVIGFDAIARDISKRKEAEEAMRRAEAQVRTLVENARDVIARFDRERRYLYVNPAVTHYSQRPPASFIGKRFGDSGMPTAQVALWNAAHQQVCDTGKETEVEFMLPTAKGNLYRLAYMVPEFGADGAVQSVLVVTRDISERKYTEERLRASEARTRAILNAIPDIIFRITQDGTIVDYKAHNESRQLGAPRNFIGKKLSAVFPPAIVEIRM